jgi:fumarylacetoacetase
MAIDATHDPKLGSWVASANGHPEFPIQNLPLGVFSSGDGRRRIGTAIGERVLDLGALARFSEAPGALCGAQLNEWLALPTDVRVTLRRQISTWLSDEAHRPNVEPHLFEAAKCHLYLPAAIGDYTDFYVGIHHATNVGRVFRPDNPLLPNYKHIPIGYHGRASSVCESGTPVRRPVGQTKDAAAETPSFGPSRRLDYEVELGVWIAAGNPLGRPVRIEDAAEQVAGLGLLNDWSARDIQAWEYQPLGPFLAKSFLTTISPWIVTSEALAPFRRAQPPRPAGDPALLPYLLDAEDQANGAYAITLEASIRSARMREQGLPPHRLSRASTAVMYWTVAQLIAHHTSNGCNLRPGDLLGTGTLSEETESGFGSLLEISQSGRRPVALPSGETRTFLEDGDEIVLSARAATDGYVSIGFGSCSGIVEPAAPAVQHGETPATAFRA